MMKLKPYMLVRVILSGKTSYYEQGKRALVGEVMSFQTPENTVMVRRIPGHPGTLIEVPVSAIEEIKGGTFRYVQYAVVAGNGTFPSDMLRYDSCEPVNFDLVDGYSGPKAQLHPGETELIVARPTPSQTPGWTIGRWSSFLWGIRHIRTERIGEITW